MSQDYYKTLGLERGASDDAINQAYRELARKHHPDLNQGDAASKKKFQDVQQAFEVLGDKDKRAKYDRFGHGFEGMGAGGPQGWPGSGAGSGGQPFDVGDLFGNAGGAGGGFADLFKQFSGGRGAGPGGSGPGSPRRGAPASGADLQHEITIPFSTAVSGGEAAISVPRAHGSAETITVKIPAGIEDGKRIRLRGQGDSSPLGGPDGDLLLTVHVASHPCFSRRGTRLDVTVPITLAEAVLGAKIDVPTPRGTVALSIPPGTSSGKRLRVKGQGIALADKPPGDLFVELQIVLPESMSDDQRRELAELIGEQPANPRAELRW